MKAYRLIPTDPTALAARLKKRAAKFDSAQMRTDAALVRAAADMLKRYALIAQAGTTPQQPPQPYPLRFPTMIRKMWSGGEVQAWLNALPPLFAAQQKSPPPSEGGQARRTRRETKSLSKMDIGAARENFSARRADALTQRTRRLIQEAIAALDDGANVSLCADLHAALTASPAEQPVATPSEYCERTGGCVCGGDLPRVRESCSEWVKSETIPANERDEARAPSAGRHPHISLNYSQAQQLVEFFGGADGDATIQVFEGGHAGPGLYVWCEDHPEEGASRLDPDRAPSRPERRDEVTDDDRVCADRYRWLRKQHWSESTLFVVSGGRSCIHLGTDCPTGDRLDTTIDAARAEGAA
ncbi:hypothetical protein ACTXHA_03935 [Burkholderia cenocepacia]